MYTFRQLLVEVTSDEKTTIEWLKERNLLKSEVNCPIERNDEIFKYFMEWKASVEKSSVTFFVQTIVENIFLSTLMTT